MELKRRGMIALLVTGSMAGGAVGATALSAASSTAATTNASSTPATPATPDGPGSGQNGGRFVPNENTAHEKGESAQREAQESAGRFPTVP